LYVADAVRFVVVEAPTLLEALVTQTKRTSSSMEFAASTDLAELHVTVVVL
jgi:hypothetical protein